jgi:hypothetical protein
MKRIPYGIQNFEQIRDKYDNYIFIDKTRYIEIIEEFQSKNLFFIRPRKFGKSLFLSMLDNYYDMNKKDKFDHLFGDLYIGKNPTREKNSYLTLFLSFAGIETSLGIGKLIQSFDDKVVLKVKSFIEKYSKILEIKDENINISNAVNAISYLFDKVNQKNQKLYIIIDEYDNFSNEILAKNDENLYKDLLHNEGYIRTFYKSVKEGALLGNLKIFMTGISPIMLDDLTSGFNITTNITTREEFNEMLGFTEEELLWMFDELELEKDFEKEKLLFDMRTYYNGYLFNKKKEIKLYNSTMVMYFIEYLKSQKNYPEYIIDDNIKTDYSKINSIVNSFKNRQNIDEIIEKGEIISNLVSRFSLDLIYSEKENFISLLFYLGLLTLKEEDETGVTVFKIPNYVIKTVYWDYITEKLRENIDFSYEKVVNPIVKMRMEGDISSFIEYLKEVLEILSNRDLIKFDEKNIKLLMIAFLNFEGKYLILSENENTNGYADLLLVKKESFKKFIKHEFLIEIKYLKEENKKSLEKTKIEAKEQIEKYSKSYKIKYGYDENILKKVIVIVMGKKDVWYEVI